MILARAIAFPTPRSYFRALSDSPDPNRPSSLPLEPIKAPGSRRWLGFACVAVVVLIAIFGTAHWLGEAKSGPAANESFSPR
jgi:hypothetical protein